MSITLHLGDCLDVLPTLASGSVDAVVCDPPYALVEPRSGGDGSGQAFAPRSDEAKAARRGGFMGKSWDAELPGIHHWQAVLRVLKSGGYMLAFGGTRTYHRLACAIEDAGFEIRDCIMWVYGSGFPKGKGCLKPAYEPILLARKPGSKVLPLGIDACRVPTNGEPISAGCTHGENRHEGYIRPYMKDKERVREHLQAAVDRANTLGRWPANVVHDGSEEVLGAFAAFGERVVNKPSKRGKSKEGWGFKPTEDIPFYSDTGTAARFFYCAKASRAERGEGNTHPTVKPLALMEHLCKLVCPLEGTILDPFLGSGTTAIAAEKCGFDFIGIERDPTYFAIAESRIAEAQALHPLFAEVS